MRRSNYPRANDIRDALLARAALFGRVTGTPQSTIGKRAINDAGFLFQVAKGRNLTLRSYQLILDWIDANLPATIYERQRQKSTRGTSRRGRGA